MSYGLPVLVSDIPANKEVALPADRYFRCGDTDDLKHKTDDAFYPFLLKAVLGKSRATR